MVSVDKLIKVGVKYSDQYFNDLKSIYSNAYKDNDSLEEFLNSTKDYSIGNPLDAGGFNETLSNLIVSATNDVRFSRPAQKALMQTIIRNTTGELITNVGDDVKNGVRDIVNRGYRNGKLSHTRVASEIESTLDGINNKRARCIARTEIKRAQTTSNYVVALERGANAYKYKCGAEPCDICKVDCGKVFPITDLSHLPPRHPNCCCGVVFFKDPNLPPVENKPMVDNKVTKQATIPNNISLEPTAQQLKDNLTSDELKKYREDKEMVDWAYDVMKNPNLGKKQKDYAKSRLAEIEPRFNQLKQKALDNSVKNTPKTTSKTTTTTSKPKTSVKPQTVDPNKMSSDELYDSMTKTDKKKYDKIKSQLDNYNKQLDKFGENPLLLDMKKKQLLELRKLEEKQIAKLAKKSSPRKAKKTERLYERTLDAIHDDINIPTEDLIPDLEKWINKRYKNTIEYGYHFDVKSGKIVGKELRGKKGGVAIQDKGSEYGSIHSHPTNGMSPPSAEDLITFRCEQMNHHFMPSEYEVWYVEATDHFGMMGKLAQTDLQEAHIDCVARGKAKVTEDIKKGIISSDENEIKLALDKAVGDELLKTFNSPPWNKTLTLKRYYR